jgi:archaellum component FlaC
MLTKEIKRATAQAKMMSELYARLAEAIRDGNIMLIEELSEDINTLRERLSKTTGMDF